MEVKKQRTVQEMMEEEMKRMKIKEKSAQIRKLVKQDQAELISTNVYPDFALNDGQSSPIQALQTQLQHPQTQVATPDPQPLQKTLPKPLTSVNPPASVQTQQQQATAKASRPAWALTKEQQEKQEDEEIDKLLDFMDSFDADKYAEDIEVRQMLQTLQKRVSEIQNSADWKQQWEQRVKDKKRLREEAYLKQKAEQAADDDNKAVVGDDDTISGMGVRGEAKSVVSERTQGKLLLQRKHQRHQGEDGTQKPG